MTAIKKSRPAKAAVISEVGPSLSVFMPCFNEQLNIQRTMQRALDVLDKTGLDYELIVVNDGSWDATGRIARSMAERNGRVRVVCHEKNLGYGAALRSGFAAATKDLVFYTDGDGQFDMREMPALLRLIPQYDIVSCYRVDRRDNILRKANGWLWTRLVSLMFGLKIRDIDCAFKLYKREVFDGMELTCSGAMIDTEVLVRAARKGCRIAQRPVLHYPRLAGVSTGAQPKVIFRAFRELFGLWRRLKEEAAAGQRPAEQ